MLNCADCENHECSVSCAFGARHCDGHCTDLSRRKCNHKACDDIKKENWQELKEAIGRD